MKLFVLSIMLILSGCATVKPPAIAFTQPDHILDVTVPAMTHTPPPVIAAPSPVAGSVNIEETITVQQEIPATPPKKVTAVHLTKKVTSKLAAVASAAVRTESTIIEYDDVGVVSKKTVVVGESSLLEGIVKIVALLSGTLGIYVGWRKISLSHQNT